jgi:hypothetical protein
VDTVSCSTSACVAAGSAAAGVSVKVITTSSGSDWTSEPSLAGQGTAFSGLSCYSSTSCVFVGLNSNQPVAISTVNGAPVGTGTVASQVRTQKDEVR